MFKPLLLTLSLIVIASATYRYNKETCLRRLVNGASCISRAAKGRPIDRYTCNAVNNLWQCDAERVQNGCPPELARAHKFHEFEVMKQMFPAGQNCPVFNRYVPSAALPGGSCTRRDLYKTNMGIGICGNILVMVNPALRSNACNAIDDFVSKCVNPNLARCFPYDSSQHTATRLARVAGFLEALASTLPNNHLIINGCTSPSSYLVREGMSRAWIEVEGSANAVSLGGVDGFPDNVTATYFTQEIRPVLREAVMDTTFPDEIMEVFTKRTLAHSLAIGLDRLEKGPVGAARRRRRRTNRATA